MQSLLDPARGFKLDVSQEAFEVAIGRLFGFAYVWSLGGNVGHTARDDFDEFVRELFQQVVTFPGERESGVEGQAVARAMTLDSWVIALASLVEGVCAVRLPSVLHHSSLLHLMSHEPSCWSSAGADVGM